MKNTKPKVRLWSVLTGLTAILTVAAIVGNIIANQYATTINVALNASTYKIIHGENTGDTEYFKKGFASDEEREAYEAELCATVEAEGAALLKNENNALPLASGAKVSLFGHGSVDLMYGGTGSGSVDTSKAPNLKQALEAQGITINQTLWDLYSSDSMMSKYSRLTPASISDTLEANTQYAVNEAPWSALSSAESSFAEYGDAAIVVLSRSGGEGADLPSGENGTSDSWISGQEGDGNYLALSAEEIELLKNLKALKDNGTFKNIVVLINSSNAIELDFLNPEICGEDYGIDAAMWIGDVGQTGINGVGQLLSGAVTPSGSLVDTYLYDNMANPAMYNFYTQAYPNAAEYNLLTEGVGWWNVGMASSRDANNGYEQWALMSGVARVMYNYKDRYMLTGTFRADGSSRFAKKKWGYFPSIAAAWTLSNEDFMKDVSSVQDIKLRASYGIVGSQAISPYATMGLMSATAYNFGTNSNFTGYWANDIATPELTWEKTKQFDLGLEFSLFDRRLNFSVDYFYKRTTDALLKRSIPGYVGGNSFWVNDGEISNRGIDLSVTARIMQNDRFQWTSTLNGTYLKNRVERLSGGENDFINGSSPAAGMVDYATIIKPGEAIGTFWGYEWTGLDEKGHDTYTDVDGNQMIDGGDRKVIGKANPDFTLGWNNSLSYKNWDLNLFFNGSFGAKRLNLVRYTMASAEGNSRFVTLADAYLKGFDKIGSSATYPSLTEGGNNLQPVSTKWLENADFLRLENISLSYTFPKKTTGFADLRLTFSCQNLFTITGYKGMDPAGTTFSNSSVDVDAGIDMGAYPSPRTFTFGLRMNF